MEDATLARLKRRLGIVDTKQDELLTDLIEDAESDFKLITGATAVDEKYSSIIRGVILKRYNRKGSEGMTSETVDGYSVSYGSAKTDFDEYFTILDRDFELSERKRGKVRFI